VVRAQVSYNGEQVTFTPEEVTAMVLVQLKAISENYLRTKVKDVVISIPGFFTSAQRRGTSSATNPPARARDARHPITFTAAAAAGTPVGWNAHRMVVVSPYPPPPNGWSRCTAQLCSTRRRLRASTA
jgi:hypothetical protein